jgi:hypothetical protein
MQQPSRPHGRADLMQHGDGHQRRAVLEASRAVDEPRAADRDEQRQRAHDLPAAARAGREGQPAAGDGEHGRCGRLRGARTERQRLAEEREGVALERPREDDHLEAQRGDLPDRDPRGACAEQRDAGARRREGRALPPRHQHEPPPRNAAEDERQRHELEPADEARREVRERLHATASRSR